MEDSEEDATLVARELRRELPNLSITVVSTVTALERELKTAQVELVICDFNLPEVDGLQVLALIRRTGRELPVIVVSGSAGEERAVEIMRAGAQDFLLKDRLFRLPEIVRRELAELDARNERNQARVALERTQLQLVRALDAARLSTWEVDVATGGFSYADFDAGEQLPREPSHLHWETFLQFVEEDDRQMVAAAFEQVLKNPNERMNLRFRAQHMRTGVMRWVEVRGSHHVDSSGRRIVAGTSADISEHKRLEERLLHSQKMEAMGRLAGGVAHDFNNLLTVILSSMAVLERELPDAELTRELVVPSRDAAERAANLTRQLLLFSRRETASPRPHNVDELVNGLTRLLRRVVREDLKLVFELGRVDWFVRVDAGQFEQVVMNLVVNARDATPSGGTITLSTSRFVGQPTPSVAAGEWVVLKVSDTGPGVPEELRERIFEPFFTTKGATQGTGLGLAICQSVVTQHGGLIRLLETGPGAQFEIFMPRDTTLEAADDPRAVVEQTQRSSGTILLVEDNDLVRSSLQRSLKQAGFDVLVASDGLDALELVRTTKPTLALVVTDVVMPRMSGPELARELKALTPAQVLFTSGYTGDADLGDAVAEGTLLAKPFTGAQLVARVNAMLRGPAA